MRCAGLADMSTNDIHGIESGWKVITVDGTGVGSVADTTETYIEVTSGLISHTHRYLPAATLAHVRPEVKQIGISLTHDEIEDGDWSQPPLLAPSTGGAPIDAIATATVEERDPIATRTVVDPEKRIER
jgi:hypothetical protein